ncbi:MAG: ABC transporter permease [Bryobacteraceae bacterium]
MVQDLRYCVRALSKSPGLVAAAILSLGLGIGLNLTVFGIFEAMFFRGVTAVSPDRTFHLWIGGSNRASYPNYRDIRDAKVVQDVFAYSLAQFTMGEGEKRERIYAQLVAGDYFEALGAQPMLGRGFNAQEKQPEREARVVILSYGYWQQHFNGDRGVLGQTFRLNTQPFQIVGVLPATYRSMHGFAMEPPFYVPYSAATDSSYRDRTSSGLELAFRTRPAQTADQAKAALLSTTKELERLYPKENGRLSEIRVFGIGLADTLRREGGAQRVVAFFALLGVLTATILLMACANVAVVLIARAVNRRREIAVRLAIGAGRRRVIQLFLAEGLVLSVAGLGAASVLYTWAVTLLQRLDLPMEIPFVIRPELNWRMALYAAFIAIGSALFCSLGPALEASRANVSAGLKNETTGFGGRLFSFRNILVIGQVAVSLLLLVTSLLFVRSLRDVENADPGFNVENQLRATVQFDDPKAAAGRDVNREVVERLQRVPGVRYASLAAMSPLSGMQWITKVNINKDATRSAVIQANGIGPGYFETMGIRMLSGRAFSTTDVATSPQVAMVNDAFAKQFLVGQNPLGTVLEMGKSPTEKETFQIVGVVETTKQLSLGEEPTPVLFRPLAQEDLPIPPGIHVRTEGPAASMAETIRGVIRDVAPNATVDVKTMQNIVEYSTYPNKIGAALLGGLGMLGLVLASIGLYGVLAYAVSRRIREIGVRIALGASPTQVLRVVLGQSMMLVGIGVAIGLALSLVATRPLASFLSSRVSVSDPTTLAAVAGVLLLTGLAAAFVPARRSLRVDPMAALRYE